MVQPNSHFFSILTHHFINKFYFENIQFNTIQCGAVLVITIIVSG